jgi:hypothetical protein
MSRDASQPSPLALGRIVSDTLALPGRHRARLWKGIGLPFFLIVGCAAFVAVSGLHGQPRVRGLLGAVIFCCVAAMAVVIHRLVLLPPQESNANESGRGLQRLIKAVCAMLVLWGVFVVAGIAVAYGLQAVFGAMNLRLPPFWMQTLGAAAASWVVARLCLMTPGLVVDQPDTLSTAWNLSRGNGWRLAALLVTGPWLLMLYTQLMWPRGVDRLIFVLIIVMSALLAIFMLFALSLSYRELMARAPPPTPPPA